MFSCYFKFNLFIFIHSVIRAQQRNLSPLFVTSLSTLALATPAPLDTLVSRMPRLSLFAPSPLIRFAPKCTIKGRANQCIVLIPLWAISESRRRLAKARQRIAKAKKATSESKWIKQRTTRG